MTSFKNDISGFLRDDAGVALTPEFIHPARFLLTTTIMMMTTTAPPIPTMMIIIVPSAGGGVEDVVGVVEVGT